MPDGVSNVGYDMHPVAAPDLNLPADRIDRPGVVVLRRIGQLPHKTHRGSPIRAAFARVVTVSRRRHARPRPGGVLEKDRDKSQYPKKTSPR